MKAFKVFVLVFLSVNIVIWLVTYFLNINLFSILQIQTPNIEVREPSYKLTTNVSKSPIGNFDPVFILYDEDCNKYGPYKLSEAVLEIQNGLSTTCSSLISDENDILINLHDRRDASLTNVVGKNMGKISAWYDNEWGFSNRMCDIAKYLHKIS